MRLSSRDEYWADLSRRCVRATGTMYQGRQWARGEHGHKYQDDTPATHLMNIQQHQLKNSIPFLMTNSLKGIFKSDVH